MSKHFQTKYWQISAIAVLMIHYLPASVQTLEQSYIDQLNRFAGNKVILLENWTGSEIAAWNHLLDEDGIFEYDIKIIQPSDWSSDVDKRLMDPLGFEQWLANKYALRKPRWILLDASNQLISYGTDILDSKELIFRMEKVGLINPINQLRNFLKIHPDHLEARSDLLRQLRRRAVKLTEQEIRMAGILTDPSNQTCKISADMDIKNELNLETDLIIWASFAYEVDKTFMGNWHGITIPFFRAEYETQVEKYSPTMRAVFARHIAKIESALREIPTSNSMWDIWGWMARCLENRDWKKFLKGMDAFSFPGGQTCPAPNVAAWLAREAMAAGDWEQVVELAKIAVEFYGYPGETRSVWFPGGWGAFSSFDGIKGYPYTSAFLPLIEGFLFLGRVEEAHTVFEDVIFFGGEGLRKPLIELAKKAGYSNIADDWNSHKPDMSVPRLNWLYALGAPSIVWHNRSLGKPYALSDIPLLGISGESCMDTFGWKAEEERWALLDETARLVLEGQGPLVEELVLETLEEMGYRSRGDLAREYLSNHLSDAYAHYVLSRDIGLNVNVKTGQSGLNAAEPLEYEHDYFLWGECAKNWLAFYENETALNGLMPDHSFFDGHINNVNNSNIMKSAAEKILPKLEKALQQRPTSSFLWQSWLAWRHVAGNERPFAPLLEVLVPSPVVQPGSFPPPMVMDVHYRECVAQERWLDASKLLTQPWERDLSIIDMEIKRGIKPRYNPQTWTTGKLLIEALFQAGKISAAENVVEAWTSRGGQCTDLAQLIELAKELDYKGLAEKWKQML